MKHKTHENSFQNLNLFTPKTAHIRSVRMLQPCCIHCGRRMTSSPKNRQEKEKALSWRCVPSVVRLRMERRTHPERFGSAVRCFAHSIHTRTLSLLTPGIDMLWGLQHTLVIHGLFANSRQIACLSHLGWNQIAQARHTRFLGKPGSTQFVPV